MFEFALIFLHKPPGITWPVHGWPPPAALVLVARITHSGIVPGLSEGPGRAGPGRSWAGRSGVERGGAERSGAERGASRVWHVGITE